MTESITCRKSPIVVGIGELLWDDMPSGSHPGGATANFAFHAADMGAEALVASRVGDDERGQEMIRVLSGYGLSASFIQIDPVKPTGWVDVSLDSKGIPEYVIHEDVAWDFIEPGEELMRLASRADAVCCNTLAQRTGVSRETVRRFLSALKPGCLCAFDVNLRGDFFSAEVIDTTMKSSAILKLNDEEFPRVASMLGVPGDESGFVSAMFKNYDLRMVVLTRGDKGSSLWTREGAFHRDGIEVDVVDTVGAGDAFTAAVVMGVLAERPPAAVLQSAAYRAAAVCAQAGAMVSVSAG